MLADFKSVHFVGICGTAMASVAVALKERGMRVTGSDQNVYPPMSTFLAGQGIHRLWPVQRHHRDVVGNVILDCLVFHGALRRLYVAHNTSQNRAWLK